MWLLHSRICHEHVQVYIAFSDYGWIKRGSFYVCIRFKIIKMTAQPISVVVGIFEIFIDVNGYFLHTMQFSSGESISNLPDDRGCI